MLFNSKKLGGIKMSEREFFSVKEESILIVFIIILVL